MTATITGQGGPSQEFLNVHAPGLTAQLEAIVEALGKISNLMANQANPPESRPDKVLQGWKEIADFLGMSVSRAKRLGSSGRRDRMPVYSFHGRVYAKATALDRWRTDSSVAVGVS